jgi:hypothetical protein
MLRCGKAVEVMGALHLVKTRLLVAALVLGTGLAQAEEDTPDAKEILRGVRLSQAAQEETMQGHLRTGGTKIPVKIVIAGSTIRYDFPQPPSLLLNFGESGSRLQEVGKGGSGTVKGAAYATAVQGTDISYEDLSMNFLYWPDAKVLGEDTRLTRKCWLVEAHPGGEPSQYGTVRLWVEKQSGALLGAEAYNRAGKLARRFTVRSVQQVQGAYFLKQMRIESMGSGKDGAPTYLEITKVGT